jgi:hypothetical protein
MLAGIAAMGIAFGLGQQSETPSISVLAATHTTDGFEIGRDARGVEAPHIRLASLEAGFISEPTFGPRDMPTAASSSDRIQEAFDVLWSDQISFEERFSGFVEPGADQVAATEELQDIILPPPDSGERKSPVAAAKGAANSGPRASAASTAATEKPIRTAETQKDWASQVDGRAAIYDISARLVYLPNGRTLEAHSGFAEHMDDPRYVHVKSKGPTPPNVYALSMREQLFHGVRAIRLTPVGGGNMYGREGILAHSYMLGPNGQSNGCVSFSDYQAFLDAYLNGEIDRIVVVDQLAPSTETASGWFPDFFKSFFIRS